MDYVAVTLSSPKRMRSRDLFLPLDVPQYILIDVLTDALELDLPSKQRGFLVIKDGEKGRELPWQRTLREAGIKFGQSILLEFREISARAFLRCVTGPKFDLEKNEITIGCRSDMDIDLRSIPNQEFVSGKHATICYQDGAFFLKDLGSLNGTKVNGSKILANISTRLDDGDEILLGATQQTGILLILQMHK